MNAEERAEAIVDELVRGRAARDAYYDARDVSTKNALLEMATKSFNAYLRLTEELSE